MQARAAPFSARAGGSDLSFVMVCYIKVTIGSVIGSAALMRLQVLVSAMNRESTSLLRKMNITTDVLVVNQADRVAYRRESFFDHTVDWFDCDERGVGLSRNTALDRAAGEFVLFADEDCSYVNDLESEVIKEFDAHPDVDVILFDIEPFNVGKNRRSFRIEEYSRISWFNFMKYGLVHCAARLAALRKANISFSLLFGGGTKYSCGEDTIFYADCLKSRLKIITSPVTIGKVDFSLSSWFSGYSRKYLYDRGALNRHIFNRWAPFISLYFALKHRAEIESAFSLKESLAIMKEGSREYSRRG